MGTNRSHLSATLAAAILYLVSSCVAWAEVDQALLDELTGVAEAGGRWA